MSIGQTFENLLNQTAFANLSWGNYVMILGCLRVPVPGDCQGL